MRKKRPTVTAVLNVFRRQANFSDQLEAVKKQSHAVSEILVWCNSQFEFDESRESNPPVIFARCSENLGVWARFAFALNAKSEFIWIIDDDTIPGILWLQNALDTFGLQPGVVGSRGLRFASTDSYLLYEEFGPQVPNDARQMVDLVGHNWIFPREWLSYFWGNYSKAFGSRLVGEDLHLAFTVKQQLGLTGVVPPHPETKIAQWGEINLGDDSPGNDEAAISKRRDSLRLFEQAYKHYVSLGFTPLAAGNIRENCSEPGITKIVGKFARLFPRAVLFLARTLRVKKKGSK